METQYVRSSLLGIFGLFGVGALMGLSVMAGIFTKYYYGEVADAEIILRAGQVYECVTPLVRVAGDNDDGYDWWYAIVKIEDECFGLKFKYEPPLKGVVAKQQGTIVFIRTANSDSGVTISNPLPLPAENPTE